MISSWPTPSAALWPEGFCAELQSCDGLQLCREVFLCFSSEPPCNSPGSELIRRIWWHWRTKSISTGDEGESHHLAVQDSRTESSMISLMHGVYVQDCTKINSPAAGKCGTFISGWALSKKILALSKKYCCLLSSSASFSGKKYEKHLWRSMSGTPPPLVKYSPRIHFCHDIFFICFKSFWALSMLKWKDRKFSRQQSTLASTRLPFSGLFLFIFRLGLKWEQVL